MSSNDVAILMASYNGAKYISNQIESIISQSYKNWDLYIRDDGSSDGTINIIKNYIRKDNRIHLIVDKKDEHGACLNFYNLIRYAKKNLLDYSYFFLSDQDDIWCKEKIYTEVEKLKCTQINVPNLIYTDLKLCDENGNDTNVNMSDIHDIELKNYPDIFMNQIFVWGNTVAFNKNLLKNIVVPNDISNELSHDHYLTFFAATYGNVIYIDLPLTYYRRHENNVSDLPSSYNFVSSVEHIIKRKDEILDSHIQMYKNVLYFIHHNKKTDLTTDIENALKQGGYKAYCVIKKYKITPGPNRQNAFLNKFILFLGIQKKYL